MAKRETHAERRERERNRGEKVLLARCVVTILREGREKGLSAESFMLLGRFFCSCDADELRVVADLLEDTPQSIEDVILAQPRHSCKNRNGWYDDEIGAAYMKALGNVFDTLPPGFSYENAPVPDSDLPFPTFSEFWDSFQKQNPKAKLVPGDADRETRRSLQRKGYSCHTEHSLRRSLQRLGYRTRPAKRGRPKRK